MANASVCRHVVITGPPGVGKTTLIKKTCDAFERRHIPVHGFYTQECRDRGNRIGFDVITLAGNRQPLARLRAETSQNDGTHYVGKYRVLLSSFEACALPTLTLPVDPAQMPVIVVDEIGKMELFSHRFEQMIRQLMSRHDLTVLATIPDKRKLPVALVDEIRRSSTVRLFEINTDNRRYIGDTIVDAVITAYEAQK